MYPRARTADLVIEELPTETIVYDTMRHRAHCLNQTASLIWRHCDGQTSVQAMAEMLSQTLGVPADLDIVRIGLRGLTDCRLLVGESADTNAVSRRELTKRLSVLGGAFIALVPAITSIVAPTPAMAKSPDDHGKGGGPGHKKRR